MRDIILGKIEDFDFSLFPSLAITCALLVLALEPYFLPFIR